MARNQDLLQRFEEQCLQMKEMERNVADTRQQLQHTKHGKQPGKITMWSNGDFYQQHARLASTGRKHCMPILNIKSFKNLTVYSAARKWLKLLMIH